LAGRTENLRPEKLRPRMEIEILGEGKLSPLHTSHGPRPKGVVATNAFLGMKKLENVHSWCKFR